MLPTGDALQANLYVDSSSIGFIREGAPVLLRYAAFPFQRFGLYQGRVKEITKGELCAVVYDGIGKTTFPASLDCLRPLGMFASFGSASGQIDAFNINILQTKGSLFATRPTLNTYAAKREDLLAIANDLFAVVGSGAVKIPVNQKYALRDAAKAHRDLQGRATTGSSILVP